MPGRTPATEPFVAPATAIEVLAAPAPPPPVRPLEFAPPVFPSPGQGLTTPSTDWESADIRPFQFAGAWYMRRVDGVVGRWDATLASWAWQPAASLPFFMRRPRFASLRTPAIWIYASVAAFVLASAFALFADFDQIRILTRIENGKFVPLTTVDRSDALYDGAKGFQAVAYLTIGALFLWWTRRATCNARALGAREARYGPWSAVLWWVVPIASLFQPFRVIRQAWRAADPALPLDESSAYATRPIPVLLWAWWIVYVAVTGAWGGMVQARDDADTAEALLAVTRVALALDIAIIAAAVLAVLVVFALTRRQEAANARFNLPSGLERLPEPSQR